MFDVFGFVLFMCRYGRLCYVFVVCWCVVFVVVVVVDCLCACLCLLLCLDWCDCCGVVLWCVD